jgi:tol-pal system protein YbgF
MARCCASSACWQPEPADLSHAGAVQVSAHAPRRVDELQHQVQGNPATRHVRRRRRRLAALRRWCPCSRQQQRHRPTCRPQGDDPELSSHDLLKDGKYPGRQRLQAVPDDVPTSALADNAQYWLGEAHYVTKAYPDALRDFRTVLEKYPDSRKTPDALLKIGFCNYELKNWAEARSSLSQVVQRFGDTTAARLASQRLAKMDGEGR